MARTEYYDDPNAPKPNSMVVAASAGVTDEQGRILLQRRRDNDLWALPGGGMDLTDSLPGTAVREVKEETGLDAGRHIHRTASSLISADSIRMCWWTLQRQKISPQNAEG